jgi:hypothetical protein
MSRRRDMSKAREAKALALLRLRRRASAAEIGWAAAKGEGARGYWRFAQAQELGLAIATQMVRDGIARPTSKNEFEFWKEPPRKPIERTKAGGIGFCPREMTLVQKQRGQMCPLCFPSGQRRNEQPTVPARPTGESSAGSSPRPWRTVANDARREPGQVWQSYSVCTREIGAARRLAHGAASFGEPIKIGRRR